MSSGISPSASLFRPTLRPMDLTRTQSTTDWPRFRGLDISPPGPGVSYCAPDGAIKPATIGTQLPRSFRLEPIIAVATQATTPRPITNDKPMSDTGNFCATVPMVNVTMATTVPQ